MAPARRYPPIYMFNRYADLSQLTGEPAGEGWIKMECDSKKVYGYGENIQEAVKGLALYARLGDDPLISSSMAIRMTDEALRRFNKELELDISPAGPGLKPGTTGWAQILMHAEDLTVITLCLDRRYYRKLSYYLVYDHKRASLSIIEPVEAPAVVLVPVPRRTRNGDYELFYLAFDCPINESPSAPPDIVDSAPFLCVFSPARAGAANDQAAAAAWEMRRNMRCSVPVSVKERFSADLAFAFQGKGFWVDLSQGLEYCDLDTAAAGDKDSVVDFRYIELPQKYVLDLEKALELHLQEPMEATRTMACGRDSIWFVCIDESISDDCADNLVSMWTLKLHGGKGRWKNEVKFSLRHLWRFDGFKEAGLPEAPMRYPLLSAEDGVLYLVLSGKYMGADAKICWVDHMCSFDVRNKKLLWHGIVHNLPVTQPAAFPSRFFQTESVRHPAAAFPSRFFQTESVRHPAAGLALLLHPDSKVVRYCHTAARE